MPAVEMLVLDDPPVGARLLLLVPLYLLQEHGGGDCAPRRLAREIG